MGAEPSATCRERALYLPAPDALIIADLHIGRGRHSNVELPLGAVAAMEARLKALLDAFEPTTVVLAGDVLHSFAHVSTAATEELERLVAVIKNVGATPVLVAGNHDTMLEEIADPVAFHRLSDGTVVCHGHDVPDIDAERYVIGHEHPAIEIEGTRRPCVLWGPAVWEGADVYVLPAFNELARGTRVNGLAGRDTNSPFLQELDRFRPIVYDEEADESLTFPPLGELQAHL